MRPPSCAGGGVERWRSPRQTATTISTKLHEINVTPFIDVMLVLLIIFMVAAPLSTVDVAVELPVSTAQPQPRPDKPLFLTMKADLSLALGNDTVPRERAGGGARCRDRAATASKRMFLRADKTVPYGELMRADGSAARRRLPQGGARRASKARPLRGAPSLWPAQVRGRRRQAKPSVGPRRRPRRRHDARISNSSRAREPVPAVGWWRVR